MEEITAAGKRRAIQALASVDKLMTFEKIVDTVVAALTESHPAREAAAEALRQWNNVDPHKFIVQPHNATSYYELYLIIADVVLAAAEEYEATTEPVTFGQPAQPWVPQVGTKVQWTRPALAHGESVPQYGTVVYSDSRVTPSTHLLIEPEDFPNNPINHVLVPVADVLPDQRTRWVNANAMNDDSYDQIRRTLIRARLFCKRQAKEGNNNAVRDSADKRAAECQAAIRALAVSTGRPWTCHAAGCVRELPADSEDILCDAHAHKATRSW